MDDDSAGRDFTRSVLEQEGFAVHEASDGLAALETVGNVALDCIVLDLVMPGLSGFDTLRAMRKAHPILPPVVVLTSMDGGGTRVYATTVNRADAFVTKADLLDQAVGLVAQVRRLTAR